MFEKDPTRETVAQRRSRKARHQNTSPLPSRGMAPTTDNCPIRQLSLKLFRSTKKENFRPSSQTKKSIPRNAPAREQSRPRSSSATGTVSTAQDVSAGSVDMKHPITSFLMAESADNYENNAPSPADEPNFTSWARLSIDSDSTWSYTADSDADSHTMQPLSPTSFFSRSTDISIPSYNDTRDISDLITVVHISSEGRASPESPSQYSQPSPSFSPLKVSVDGYPFPLIPSPKLRKDMNEPFDKYMISHGNRSDVWKQPESPSDAPMIPRKSPLRSLRRAALRLRERELSLPQSELSRLQSIVRRMDSARPKTVLERLTGDWPEVTDLVQCGELQLEKRLWMRTALQVRDNELPKVQKYNKTCPRESIKILSLYDDDASASFLSARGPSNEVHHLSTSPLSQTSFPNIYPHPISEASTKLPFAGAIFSSIHSFSLPAQIPSFSIPTLLKECHRTLLSSRTEPSTLHLTLIDPSPCSATTGPKLRTWLNTRLIPTLEKQFRCLNPTRLLPILLADAGLSGAGSVLTTVPFAAAMETALVSAYNTGVSSEDETREQLRSVVGRKLWEETWGAFIEGDERWWDDGDVVEECVRLGTVWEYLVVEAVRDE